MFPYVCDVTETVADTYISYANQGINFIKLLQVLFTSLNIILESTNNSFTCLFFLLFLIDPRCKVVNMHLTYLILKIILRLPFVLEFL